MLTPSPLVLLRICFSYWQVREQLEQQLAKESEETLDNLRAQLEVGAASSFVNAEYIVVSGVDHAVI